MNFDEKNHLQYWDKASSAPSKRDALIVLMSTLYLLSEALPIAMAHVGSENIAKQQEFWFAFKEVDERTDLSDVKHGLVGSDYAAAVGEKIYDWYEFAQYRISQPSGDLGLDSE